MFEDINAFCVIAKHQSFSKAARELEISTPVITRRLARLEQSLGVRLLNRTTRQVTLTEAGSLFFTEVSDILQTLEASKEGIKSMTSQVAGTLKIAIPVSLSECYVVPGLKCFLSLYPNLKIQIVTGFNQLHLLNHGFDLVIQCGELPESSFYYKKIHAMKKVICASPFYLKEFGAPKTIDELQQHNCLGIQEHFQTWQIKVNGVIKDIPVTGNIQVNSGTELKSLALHGLGIAYLPQYMVQAELNKGELVALLDQYEAVEHALYAVYPTKKYMVKKTQLFLDYITNLLQESLNNCGKH
jgi:DNA-binding transcriptional LysR family regulator